MRVIDIIAIFLIWLAMHGCASNNARFIQDLQFDNRMVIFQPAYWHIQTNSRPDSVSWRCVDPNGGKLYGWQPATNLNFISIAPFTVKGALGEFTPQFIGTFMFEITVWSRWNKEEIKIYRTVVETDQLWESIDMNRIFGIDEPRRP